VRELAYLLSGAIGIESPNWINIIISVKCSPIWFIKTFVSRKHRLDTTRIATYARLYLN